MKGRFVDLSGLSPFKRVKTFLRSHDITISKRDGEYRVNFAGASEATAYYTNDLEDAEHTGISMARMGYQDPVVLADKARLEIRREFKRKTPKRDSRGRFLK